jgi:hypothetical protein
MVCWLFFNFAVSLTLDVGHWLRRWVLWTTTCRISDSSLSPSCCWPFSLSSLCLLKVGMKISSLPLPPFSDALPATPFLCCMLTFSSLLIIQVFVCFLQGQGRQSAHGAMLLYPRGGWGKTVWCLVLTCCSSKCLPSRFGASVWQHGSPPVFSV